MDKQKFQYEGLKWLFELDLLNQPQAINTIKLNILTLSPKIKEVELLIYREQKSMLVLLELTWLGRKFFKRRIYTDVQDMLTQLMPTFRFRITDDPKIMNLAIEQVKRALTGGKNENANNSSIVADKQPSNSGNVQSAKANGSGTGPSSDSAESPENRQDIRQAVNPGDSKE